MLVIVSWVSFWLDPNAVPARVSLGVTTLLTMSTQTASINNSLPPVAYTKAIDVWTGVSDFLGLKKYSVLLFLYFFLLPKNCFDKFFQKCHSKVTNIIPGEIHFRHFEFSFRTKTNFSCEQEAFKEKSLAY